MYYKVWETAQISKKLLRSVTKSYYKVWQVLQSEKNLLQSVTGITKCGNCYRRNTGYVFYIF